jgi:murein DD-endopeptidase MepM/ murein hydrolase activator NlpD
MPRNVLALVILPLVVLLSGCTMDSARRGSLSNKDRVEPCNTIPRAQMVSKQPTGRYGVKSRDETAERRRQLEYAISYGIEYGLVSAMTHTLEQSSPEAVLADPRGSGFRKCFEDSMAWGLRYGIEPEQKEDASQEDFRAARQQAMAYMRAEGFSRAVDDALREAKRDPKANEAIKAAVMKAMDAFVEQSLYSALDNVLHNAPVSMAVASAFIWPVNHPKLYITSTFGADRGSGGNGRCHAGVDLVAPQGVPIVAAANGTVMFAGNTGNGYGRMVKLDHGCGMETWYAHMVEWDVNEGDRVAAGQKIGEVGQTGRASTAHLHYEVHRNGQAVDPRNYMP